jgi:archaellum component FlaC
MFNLRVQEAKRRLDRALSVLIDLPDFASRNRKTPGTVLTTQTIAAYTAELKDWFSDLELHKRILMEKEKEKADLPPPPVEDTSAEPQLTAQQLVKRGKWSWNDIRNATNELDARILTTAEHLYSDVYTTIADFKDQAASLQDPCPMMSPTKTRGNQTYDAVSSTANLVGDNLTAQVTRAAELILKIHALEQEHEQLENETRAMNKFCAEVI